jgi:hypothetical protein
MTIILTRVRQCIGPRRRRRRSRSQRILYGLKGKPNIAAASMCLYMYINVRVYECVYIIM